MAKAKAKVDPEMEVVPDIEEYVVFLGPSEGVSQQPTPIKWNGAAPGCYIGDKKGGHTIVSLRAVIVQATSVEEAITGARQAFPAFVRGTTYGVPRAGLTHI